MPDRFATSAEVAATLRLSAATIQLYARSGRIPFDATPGGHRRYDIGEVQEALLGAVTDVETELERSRPHGLGRGVDAPASANAALLRELRSTRSEPEHVLRKIAPVIARVAAQGGALAAGKRTLQQKLVAATDTWLVSSTEQSVIFYPVLTEALAKATGLFNSATSSIDAGQVKAAVKLLTGDVLAAITGDGSFRVKVVPTTWDGMTAAEYLDRPEWHWEHDPDPLA